MLARRMCALAAARGRGLRAPRRLCSTSAPNSTSGGANHNHVNNTNTSSNSSTRRQPIALTLDGASDRELLRQLLRRPQRLWVWAAGATALVVALVAFAPELKLGVSKHTADVASKSLQDETLQGQTRELASQIVQTVLNDPNVLQQASQFLQRLVVMDATRDALRGLVVHTLNDPVTLAHVTTLSKRVVATLLADPATRRQVVELLRATLADPSSRQSVLLLLEQLMQDEQTRRSLTQLLGHTVAQDVVKKAVSSTLGEAVHDVLSRVDVQNHAKLFVGTVVKDQTVQAQSGDAIWSTFMYAVTPGWLSWIWQSADATKAEKEVAAVAAAEVAAAAAAAAAVESVAVVEETRTSSGGANDTVENVVIVSRKVPPTRTRTGGADDSDTGSVVSEGDSSGAKTTVLSKRPTTSHRRLFPRRKTKGRAESSAQHSDEAVAHAPSVDSAKATPQHSPIEVSDEFDARDWNSPGSGFL
ncbi:hypothetical protein PybrP1_000396 [[Pythium] brassicae (nom. inval.)]|nr:hypothetical protein PybrP1_000396 [[Pythium] brassicae (nom. inval.)]